MLVSVYHVIASGGVWLPQAYILAKTTELFMYTLRSLQTVLLSRKIDNLVEIVCSFQAKVTEQK